MTWQITRIAARAFLLLAPGISLAAKPGVTEHAGQLEYHSSDGKTIILATGDEFRSPALSPDGQSVAYIHVLKPNTPDRDGESELWIADGPSGKTRRLVTPSPSGDPKANLQWFDQPVFSGDGKSVYISAQAWGDEEAVHQVDVVTGRERFIIDGSMDSVVRTGPYRGDLLVRRHTPLLSKAGYHYPIYVVQPNGTIQRRVPGMDRDDDRGHLVNWLDAHGWAAW